MKHIIRPAAKEDMIRQFRYYLVVRGQTDVANRFLEAVGRTIAKIMRTPKAGAPKHVSNKSLTNLRWWPVEGFEDIGVYYLFEEAVVQVVRVLHGKRDIQGILERENDGRSL